MERELWTVLYAISTKLDKPWGRWKFSTSDIVVVYLWSVVHDRPMSWALIKAHWPEDLRPICLPSQSQLSRRMRKDDVRQLMMEVEHTWLGLVGVYAMWVRMIDGKRWASAASARMRMRAMGVARAECRKAILGQLVLHVLKHDGRMRAWYQRIKRRRGAKIARVAVMRRLATILWHMVKHQQPYQYQRVPRPCADQPQSAFDSESAHRHQAEVFAQLGIRRAPAGTEAVVDAR